MSNYGVTPQGFRKKRLDVIKQELESDISINLGVPINTAPDSTFSQVIAPFSDKLSEVWDALEAVYHSMYPSSAEGSSLVNAVSFTGVKKKTATKTKIEETCHGTEGTKIPSGSKIRRTSGKVEYFSTTQEGVITADSARLIKVKISIVAENMDYTVTLNNTSYTYRSLDTPTEVDILNGIKNNINSIDWIGSIDENILTIDRANKKGGYSFSVSNNLLIDSVASNLEFYCDEYGPINPPVGYVNEIVTPISGWLACSNDLPAIIGQNTESDTELRQSYSSRVSLLGKSMVDSIKANILQNVSGVNFCKVYENPTSETDLNGIPPHSIECIVEGGSEQEIAEQIFNQKTGGAGLFGTTSVMITDSTDVQNVIKFNRPTKINVWAKVVAAAIPGKTLPSNVTSIITKIIVEEGNKTEPGNDIVPQQFYGAIYSAVQNLGTLNIKAAISDTIPLDTDYVDLISLTSRQQGIFNSSRVVVN